MAPIAQLRVWHTACFAIGQNMGQTVGMRIKRLFMIKTRFEASLIIYALALGCIERGLHYLDQFPGFGGWLLLIACTGSVFLAGAKIFDALRYERAMLSAE